MIQRAIGVTIGGVITLILLLIMTPVTINDAIVPIVVGAIAAWLWPWVIAIWLGRRARERQQDRIEEEVQRQMREQGR
jgi:preprotein translocase subunit SecF